MFESDIQYSAAALYDGGWRAADRDQLIKEYDMDEEKADHICEYLARYEAEATQADDDDTIPLF